MKDLLHNELHPGDNVLIIVPDDDYFHSADGIVKSIGGEKVVVEFGKEYASIFASMCIFGDHIYEFEGKKLQKFNLVDHPEIRAKRIYGSDRFHHLQVLKYRFSAKNNCMKEGCPKESTKRIIFNAWGTVSEYDVCDEHGEHDGWCGDGFHIKPNYYAKEQNSY
ncbi:MAG: hypothetical protein NTX91_05035 [candidate division SR1 bacterium]|nr:hypothetical protein [candidate division SR1 bacterium]